MPFIQTTLLQFKGQSTAHPEQSGSEDSPSDAAAQQLNPRQVRPFLCKWNKLNTTLEST